MPQLGVTAQQNAESFKPLGNALGVIHAVDPEDNEVVTQLTSQLNGLGFYFPACGVAGKLVECNANRESGDRGSVLIERNNVVRLFPFRCCFGDDSLDAAQKIKAITVSLKSEQMIVQQRSQDGLAPRQLLENVRRRKRNMKEESRPALTA